MEQVETGIERHWREEREAAIAKAGLRDVSTNSVKVFAYEERTGLTTDDFRTKPVVVIGPASVTIAPTITLQRPSGMFGFGQ